MTFGLFSMSGKAVVLMTDDFVGVTIAPMDGRANQAIDL